MKNKQIAIVSILLLIATLIGGCSGKGSEQGSAAKTDMPVIETTSYTETDISSVENDEIAEEVKSADKAELPDGVYTADFDTDSGMFHVSEACDGKGTLTVHNGKMTIHISLGSKKILKLYPGFAKDAGLDGAELLLPTVDTVTYSDGMTEEVYGFDVPVPALEEEFDLALIGTKGKWYDHKVSVTNPQPLQDETTQTANFAGLKDGIYTIGLTFEGGSGKAKILSPASITVSGEKVTAVLQWNSPNYDYMIVNGVKYLPVNTEGDSVFEVPVLKFDEPADIIGDTIAMSKPHEVEYTLTFHSDTIKTGE